MLTLFQAERACVKVCGKEVDWYLLFTTDVLAFGFVQLTF